MLGRHSRHGLPLSLTAVGCTSASVARKLYMRQGMGVGLFRTIYGGGNKTRGIKPERHGKGSGERWAG